MPDYRRRVDLPEQLAPSLREAAERLLAETEPPSPSDANEGAPRHRCWRCGETGPLTWHHLDDGTLVPVHPRCHRKLHGQAGGKSRRRRSKKGRGARG